MSDEVKIRESISQLPGYKAGGKAQPVAGLAPYKLSSNENPLNPLPSVVAVIAEAAASINRYPDPLASELTEKLADKLSVPAGAIALGTGSVGVCQQIVQALCDAGDEVIYAWRSFEAYPIITSIAGAISVRVALTPTGEHDLAAMAAAITERTRVIFICTPNNPTGTIVHQRDLDSFMTKVPKNVLVVIDEAYIEFNRDAEAIDGLASLNRYSNVGILRTFSKAYGLAGLRVGYFVGPAAVAEAVKKTAVPFGVSSLAQAAAISSLDQEVELLDRVESLVQLRNWFESELTKLGFQLLPSQANFVWLALGRRTDEFFQACNEVAVAVRPFTGEGVRISIGEREALERLLPVCAKFL
jgi:histidinol-phosphate aminotransferase